MVNRRWGFCAALVAVVVAVTAACGTDSSSDSERPAVDVATLDVGNLNAEPRYLDKPTNLDMARVVESWRIGNHLPLPMDIDPELTFAPTKRASVRAFTALGSAAIVNRFYGDTTPLESRISEFVTGWVTAGRSGTVRTLSWELDNVAMLFETEQAAADAADIFTDVERSALGAAAEPQTIPQFPAARAHMNRELHGSIQSYLAVGRFLLLTSVQDNVMRELGTTDPEKLRNRVVNSIEKLKPALESFTPTPVDKLMELDVDPDKVLARALNTVDDPAQFGIPGLYTRQGGLQIGFNPGVDSRMFEEAGVDAVAWKGGYVYRAKNARAAEYLVDQRAKVGKFYRRAASPPNLPFAQCLEYIGPIQGTIYYCGVSFDRYMAEVTASQLLDAHQRMSAQYAILTKVQ